MKKISYFFLFAEILTLICINLYSNKVYIEEVSLDEILKESQLILLVEKKSNYSKSREIQLKCQKNSMKIKYKQNYHVFKVLEEIHNSTPNSFIGKQIEVHMADEGFQKGLALKYQCDGIRKSYSRHQYKPQAIKEFDKETKLILFLKTVRDGIFYTYPYSYEGFGMLSDIKKKRSIKN